MQKIRNREIYEKWKAGISAEDISKEEGISRARVYQLISAERAKEHVEKLPLIDDSRAVLERDEKIKTLEERVLSLEADNRRLLGIIEKLIK